ncbi:GNAT family N-acetyltransferase [Shewanella psychropiezotolerans]|uniref:GNAT family N-acetyltransferase n=1 Tax=Shewanella psychropiezotolerans TaxID=2593655 RepID=A0ABX5X3V9_9GAMM|nr:MULTISPECIES: GNAT family N-acetyltransferase [Shewanella]MPY25542.1 GNAT family N-acetyltransferase [Shewanella sp. YLB-07]QDO86034.1 GNAT family N-acetyltransferase [Shewanella psychropiezotolerans]
MSKIITETQRLIIREFNHDDAKAVYHFNAPEEVNRFTGDAGMCSSIEDAEKIIRDIWLKEYRLFGYGRWAVVLKETDEVIGFCGFKNDSRIEAIDIGYRFHPTHWGKGYATESNLTCIEYAKQHLDLNRVLGDAVAENLGSINVLLKLGMSYISQYQEDGFTINRYETFLKT